MSAALNAVLKPESLCPVCLWKQLRLIGPIVGQALTQCCAAQVKETVRDVKLLHNEQFFAAAQKKYVYIYDKRGLEVHCLKVAVKPCMTSMPC